MITIVIEAWPEKSKRKKNTIAVIMIAKTGKVINLRKEYEALFTHIGAKAHTHGVRKRVKFTHYSVDTDPYALVFDAIDACFDLSI